MRDLLNKCCD